MELTLNASKLKELRDGVGVSVNVNVGIQNCCHHMERFFVLLLLVGDMEEKHDTMKVRGQSADLLHQSQAGCGGDILQGITLCAYIHIYCRYLTLQGSCDTSNGFYRVLLMNRVSRHGYRDLQDSNIPFGGTV